MEVKTTGENAYNKAAIKAEYLANENLVAER
jgi:hypothetical protein